MNLVRTAPWIVLLIAITCMAGSRMAQAADPGPDGMREIATAYVKLVLALGLHDDGYVDAYYGPAEWRAEVERERPALPRIDGQAAALLARLAAQPTPAEPLAALRQSYLARQLQALRARVAMLQEGGTELSFDAESKALYDAVAPTHPEAHFQSIVAELDAALPGEGEVAARYQAWREDFAIPPPRLDAVFRAAIDECRRRTLQHITLPDGEQFTLEYVTDKPWSGYNWYQGGYRSLIQVNTDLPVFIDRAIDLACHEGYPGHHVYNVLLEQHLTRGRDWPEFSVYALYSPQSLIAEGTANYGIEVAFPGEERQAWEREVLFPLAGLDPSRADEYYRVQELVDRLSYAGNEAARRYLDGSFDRAGAEAWLVRYGLMEPARAAQRVRFIDAYRSYVINYNLGKDLVRRHVEAQVGSADGDGAGAAQVKRWKAFEALLSSPRLPSGLEDGKASAAQYDPALAARLGADARGMRRYVLVILKTGPTRVPDGDQRKAMFAGHFANMERLAAEGKLALAGPFAQQGDWRGLFLLAVEDVEEARRLTETDPVIVQGEMVAEYHPWYGSAAVMQVPEIHRRLEPPAAD